MKNKLFSGIMPALVTPFDADKNLKADSALRLMNRELQLGVDGFYINGATGEGLFLPEAPRRELAELAVETCRGRGAVINHVGAVDVEAAVRLAAHAGRCGCDAVSSLVPNYVASYSDDQIIGYYKRLADAAGVPVLVYCTGLLKSSPMEFIEKVMKVDGVAGLKFTMTNYFHMQQITLINDGDINVINGPDEMLICGLTMGADGGIGTTYNLMPEWFVALYKAFRAGEYDKARELQYRINKVIRVILNHECLPATKETLNIQGYDVGNVAYPGKTFDEESRAALIADLKAAGYDFQMQLR